MMNKVTMLILFAVLFLVPLIGQSMLPDSLDVGEQISEGIILNDMTENPLISAQSKIAQITEVILFANLMDLKVEDASFNKMDYPTEQSNVKQLTVDNFKLKVATSSVVNFIYKEYLWVGRLHVT